MHDAAHVRPVAIDPEVKTHGGVGRAFSFQHVHVVVDADDRLGPDLIERLGQRRGVEGAVIVLHRDLPRQGLGVPFPGQDPAAQGDLLPHVPVAEIQLLSRPLEERIGL
ncbi:hypothetical protein D3C73_1177690 [compost metagenome]